MRTVAVCKLLLLSSLLMVACHDSPAVVSSVNTVPPTANAGATQHVTIPVTVTLDGSSSSSADGGSLTYSWSFVGLPTGSTAALVQPTAVAPTFTPDIPGNYVVQLIVSEGALVSTAATVTIGASGTVELLTNGSFESGLTGWTSGVHLQSGAAGNYSFNADVAPGTETFTSTAGWPATDGSNLALGYVEDTANNGNIITAALYQDIAIPASATTVTLSCDIGAKNLQNGAVNTAARIGLYSASSLHYFNDTPATGAGTSILYGVTSADAALVHKTTSALNAATIAGTTVRFMILNAANGNMGAGGSGHEVIGVDNVKVRAFLSY